MTINIIVKSQDYRHGCDRNRDCGYDNDHDSDSDHDNGHDSDSDHDLDGDYANDHDTEFIILVLTMTLIMRRIVIVRSLHYSLCHGDSFILRTNYTILLNYNYLYKQFVS